LKEAKEKRMKALQGLSEMEEYRLAKGQGHGIRNPFLEREKDNQQKQLLEQKKKKIKTDGNDTTSASNKDGTAAASTNTGDKNNDDQAKNKDDEDDPSDPPKFIYKYLKGLLKEWEQELADRPESVARSVAGRNESKTLKQCKDYIRPLFKLLKSRTLEDGLQFHLMKIVTFAKEGEFVKAHDAYMDVSIGRSAWPIGVTMVGIHARSGRAKIESANVAHVMNSELQRKYLTSVKRLLSYAQKKRVDVDPSKKVM
jgi:pre-mRNA-splicing factor 18